MKNDAAVKVLDNIWNENLELLAQMYKFLNLYSPNWILAIFSAIIVVFLSLVFRKAGRRESNDKIISSNGNIQLQNEKVKESENNNNNNTIDASMLKASRISDTLTEPLWSLGTSHVPPNLGKATIEKAYAVLGSLPDFQKSSFAAIILRKKIKRFPSEKDVICIGTGQFKNVNPIKNHCDSMRDPNRPSMVIKDTSAVSLVRRAFVRFLQDEMEKFTFNPYCEDSVLTLKNDSKGYTLRKDYEIIFVLNSLPSGFKDLSFEGSETAAVEKTDRGDAPSKIEESHKSVSEIPPEERKNLLEKLMFWCFAGIQGSILSNCLEPVFINHIILLNCHDIVQFKENFETLFQILSSNLPKHNKPFTKPNIVNEVVDLTEYKVDSSHTLIRNWIKNSNHVEIIDEESGKNTEGRVSRLCEAVLFDKFYQMKRHLKFISEADFDPNVTSYMIFKTSPAKFNNLKRYFKALIDQ